MLVLYSLFHDSFRPINCDISFVKSLKVENKKSVHRFIKMIMIHMDRQLLKIKTTIIIRGLFSLLQQPELQALVLRVQIIKVFGYK